MIAILQLLNLLQELLLISLLAIHYPRKQTEISLIRGLKKNDTGLKRIRAVLPKGWIAGDKTGSGDNGTVNDTAVIWLPSGEKMVISIFLTKNNKKVIPFNSQEMKKGEAQIRKSQA